MTDAQLTQLVSDVVVKVLVALALAAASYAATHWAWYQRAEAALSDNTLLGSLARTAVRAAEQSLAGAPGSEKKHQALDWMTLQAEAHGVKATPAMVSRFAGMIEASVHDMKRAAEFTAPPVVVDTAPPADIARPAPSPQAMATPFAEQPGQRADGTISAAASPPDPMAGETAGVGGAATPETRVAAGRQKGASA